jgi:hypothetical protein
VTATFLPFNTSSSTGIVLPFNDTNTLSITALAGAPAGSYTINLTGTDSSGNTATAQIEFDVTSPFALNASPPSLTIPPGSSSATAISAIALGSESGLVSLSGRVFGQNGPVIDGSVAVTFSPASIGISSGASSAATVTVASNVPIGSAYTINVVGTDAGGNKTNTTLNLTVNTPTLKLWTNPTNSLATGGGAVNQSVTVHPSGGVRGAVNLSAVIAPSGGGTAPSGLTLTFSPSSATIDADDDKLTFTASFSAASSVPVGTYIATITGVDGIVTGATTVTITVSAMTLSVTDKGYTPTNPAVGALVTDQLTANLSPTPTGTVSYTWSEGPVWFSTTDAKQTFGVDNLSDYQLGWQAYAGGALNSLNVPQLMLTASFNSAGYYVVQATCTATVVQNGVTTVLTGTCYMGGPPSIVESGQAGANAKAAAAANANAVSLPAFTWPWSKPVKVASPPYEGMIAFVHSGMEGQGSLFARSMGSRAMGYTPLRGRPAWTAEPGIMTVFRGLENTNLRVALLAGHGESDGAVLCIGGTTNIIFGSVDLNAPPKSLTLIVSTYDYYIAHHLLWQQHCAILSLLPANCLANLDMAMVTGCSMGTAGFGPNTIAGELQHLGAQCVVTVGEADVSNPAILTFLGGISGQDDPSFLQALAGINTSGSQKQSINAAIMDGKSICTSADPDLAADCIGSGSEILPQ